MKKYVYVALTTLFVFSLNLTAQEQMPPKGEKGPRKEGRLMDRPEMSPEKRADRMAKQLSLTDAEKAKVQALMQREAEKMKVHREEMKKQREEMRAKFEAARKQHDEELQSIIGKEKFEKLQQIRERQMQKMHKMMERRRSDDRHAMGRGRFNRVPQAPADTICKPGEPQGPQKRNSRK